MVPHLPGVASWSAQSAFALARDKAESSYRVGIEISQPAKTIKMFCDWESDYLAGKTRRRIRALDDAQYALERLRKSTDLPCCYTGPVRFHWDTPRSTRAAGATCRLAMWSRGLPYLGSEQYDSKPMFSPL